MRRTGFCDGWQLSRNGGEYSPVIVPHDAMLGAQRDAQAPAGSASGYFHGVECRYRKRLTLDERQATRHLLLEFEGVYRDARVMVNGTEVTAPPYGFIPFFVDLTGLVHAGDNLIEVEAGNADQPDCRWYSGAGIQRPVWLWEGGEARIFPEGIRVTTLSLGPTAVRVDVEHTGGMPLVRIYDEDDNLVASWSDAAGLGAGFGSDSPRPSGAAVAGAPVVDLNRSAAGEPASARSALGEAGGTVTSCELDIPNASPWSAGTPYLYRCVVELVCDGDVVDRAETRFGVRTLSWSPAGFFVNGRETLLRGGCIHCDNGILGAASFPESERRRIRLLKQAGFNAVRIAHNPAPAALLDACDELGMYVMDETWDMWYTPKSANDYARHFLDWCDFDLRRLASRDYNHPSVIMYSIGNEVADPVTAEGVALERSLVELLHSLDPTRPVTCGFNLTMMVMERAGRGWYGKENGIAEAATSSRAPRGSMLFNLAAQAVGTGMTWIANAPGADKLVSPALDALDIAGYNYAAARYATDARKHPRRIVVGSETFPHELPDNWQAVRRLPNVIGDFMWAAWDYLGEAGAGSWAYTAEEAGFSKPWPWLFAGSGALDTFGNPNAHAALAGAVWGTNPRPSIQVRPVNRMQERTYKATWRGSDAIPCWSWSGCEGVRTQVEVYDGRAYSIRLEINGDFAGQKRVHDYVAKFPIEYTAGTLVAIALDEEGHEIARNRLVSANAPFHLEATPEAKNSHAGGIAYVPICIRGTNGQIEANIDEQLTATVEGGELMVFGSAQPAPTESFLTGVYTTHLGRAMAVVYRPDPGVAILTVRGTTLAPTTAHVTFV